MPSKSKSKTAEITTNSGDTYDWQCPKCKKKWLGKKADIAGSGGLIPQWCKKCEKDCEDINNPEPKFSKKFWFCEFCVAGGNRVLIKKKCPDCGNKCVPITETQHRFLGYINRMLNDILSDVACMVVRGRLRYDLEFEEGL